jgi:response regulator of citrate/malate metabolism
MLTATSERRHVREAISYGAKDYIVKPFEEERIIEGIENILKV